MNDRDRPVLIELDDASLPSPADAPPVAEPGGAPTGQAMQTVATLAARRPSRLGRWFWQLLASVVLFFASVAAWDFAVGLFARNVWLGWAAMGLDVYGYFDNDIKVHAPYDAMALARRLGVA